MAAMLNAVHSRLARAVLCLVVGFGLPLVPVSQVSASGGAGAARQLESIRDEPDRLAAFLRAVPKGGDLHLHPSGAVSTETLLRFAVEDGLCIATGSLVASPPPCRDGQRPAAETVDDESFGDEVVRAWSMKDFPPGPESGHDHFFATFGKFGAAADGHRSEILAEIAVRAVEQNEWYLEPLVTPQFPAVSDLAGRVGFHPDFGVMRRKLTDGGFDGIVGDARHELDETLAGFRSVLRCGTAEAEPACDLAMRFDAQVLRAMAPEVVFAQLLLGFELMESDGRFVGVNMVQPEDDPVALRDYRLHMDMIAWLRDRFRRDQVTLHAGELTPGLAPPADLRSHIHDAVVRAGAERIGHGVDVAGEDGAGELLERMARRGVLVEIALTSNRQILEVGGRDHPLALYRRAGVPVALVTDDEGVSRTDLTAQYQQAVTDHGLGYADLKAMARAAIQHAFIQGRSIWREPGGSRPVAVCQDDRLGEPDPSPACRRFLGESPKAAVEWRHEAAFARFERRFGD